MKNSSQASKKNMWQKLYLTYDFIIDAGLYPWIEEFTLQAIITTCPHYSFWRYWNAHNTYGRYIRKPCSVLTNRFGCYTGWEWKPSKMASGYTPKFSQSCWKATSAVVALWRVAWDSPRNKSSNNTSIHLRLCTWPWAIYQSLEKWDNNLHIYSNTHQACTTYMHLVLVHYKNTYAYTHSGNNSGMCVDIWTNK